jgi:general stress protein 26
MTVPLTTRLDRRYSDPDSQATPWPEAMRVLREAELYWLTTVRGDGRPHVTPLIGVAFDDAVHFCTGLEEQKARNLGQHSQVAVTTGSNRWALGLDVVVEGAARRIDDQLALRQVAQAYAEKYGRVWHFDVGDGVLVHPDGHHAAAVFRVDADKVLAFAKQPHGQTTYRFA